MATRTRRGTTAGAILSLLAAFLVAGGSSTASHADATAATDDRSVVRPTTWWTYSNITTADLRAKLSANGARLTELEPYDTTAGTWSAVMVRNTGSYGAPGWWWYVDQTTADITARLGEHNARLLDVSPYATSNGIRFATVMVSNTGSSARSWSWLAGATRAEVDALVAGSNQRLVDLSTYTENGVTKFAVVGVANAGADSKEWQWWHGQTAAQVTTRVTDFAGRLVDVTVGPDGRFNIILVKNTGTEQFYWRWYSGIGNAATLVAMAKQFGSRLVVVEPYLANGNRRFVGVMLDNATVNTRRIRSVFENGSPLISSTGRPLGSWGAYVKRVGSWVSTDLQSGLQFEPASAIKAVHSLAVMRRVQAGTDSLAAPFTYYDYPSTSDGSGSGSGCPVDVDETAENRRTDLTLNGGRQLMMADSDNRTTRGITLRYGLPAIQATAQTAGMTSTAINQASIGCGYWGGRNRTTLADLGRLYEGVENSTLLTGSHRTVFYNPMNGNAFDGEGVETGIANVVRAEAAALGKSSEVAEDFISRMNWRHKRGGYWIPCGDPGTTCSTGSVAISTVAGRLLLPVKTSATSYSTQAYVFGRFIDNVVIGCPGCPSGTTVNNLATTVDRELFREVIRAALATF